MNASRFSLHRYVGTSQQAAALADICQEWSALPTGFWSFADVAQVVKRSSILLLFVADSAQAATWCGAIVLDIGPFSADILYVFVRQDYRRMRLGQVLLQGAIAAMQARPAVEELFLEVRANNQPAIALYEAAGFQKVGIRRTYYRNGDDALVYRFQLVGES